MTGREPDRVHPDDLMEASGDLPIVVLDLDVEAPPSLATDIGRCDVPVIGHATQPIDAAGLGEVLDALTFTCAPTSQENRRVVPTELLTAGDGLAAICAAARRVPQAAAVLAATLGAGAGLPPDQALYLESLGYSLLLTGAEFRRWRSETPRKQRTGTPPAPRVLIDRADNVLQITLNRPRQHNALDAAMRDELVEALTVAMYDSSVSVELVGAGPSFCSGGDLAEFGTAPDHVASHLLRTRQSPARLLATLSERTTARVHGCCIGAGLELPAFAGRVVADPTTTFRLPELAMGLIPGAGGTVSVTRRIGRHRTAWLVLSGQTITAQQALVIGLVDELDG